MANEVIHFWWCQIFFNWFCLHKFHSFHFHTCGPVIVISTYLAVFLNCQFICMHWYANVQCHSQWLNLRVCTSLCSSCLLPVFSPKVKNWKNSHKETKICSGTGTIHRLLHSPWDVHPPPFSPPPPKKMCHLEMDYGWEKEREKRKQLVIDFKESV